MSELTKTNPVQTSINPGGDEEEGEEEGMDDPGHHLIITPASNEDEQHSHLQIVEEEVPEEGESVEVEMTEEEVLVEEVEEEEEEEEMVVEHHHHQGQVVVINQNHHHHEEDEEEEEVEEEEEEDVQISPSTVTVVTSSPAPTGTKVYSGGPVILRGQKQQLQLQRSNNVMATTSSGATASSMVAMTSQHHHQQQQQHLQYIPQKCQDVRVDNWGNYCLQRLQGMYDRGDFCDLTLQFHTNQLLKVHRVVVNLCTEYFGNLERLFGLTDGVLVLPKDVEYQAMMTIVRFFYTGKLEIREHQFNEVYRTVKLMNITILIKLLEAHSKKPPTPAKKEMTRPIILRNDGSRGHKGQVLQAGGLQFSGHPMKFGGSTALAIQGIGGTRKLQVTTPGMKLPPGAKTKTVLARVQPQSMRMHHQQVKVSGPKKLPIWKDRNYGNMKQETPTETWPIKDEPARPTRFEWGDPEEDPFSLSATPIVTHNLVEKQKQSSSGVSRKIEDIFDAVKSQTLGKRNARANESSKVSEHPPPKQHKVNATTSAVNFTIPENDISGVNLTDDTVEEEVSTTEITVPSTVGTETNTPTLKPALKSSLRLTSVTGTDTTLVEIGRIQDGNSGSKTPQLPHGKTVRFAPDPVEKENTAKMGTHVIETPADETGGPLNHSKIIAEVLKKYPDLVKDKHNIKLKIIHKGSEGPTTSSSKEKSKVSYIVLKSTSSPETMGAVLLKKSNQSPTKAFWDGTGGDKDKKSSGAENITGPWLCGPCGGGEDSPVQFETYFEYRRHLVDVHGERIDARICEYCGQRASKRNLLLYHLYTKHGVPPPKSMNFPNCDRCDYIALSDSLLSKHKLTHDSNKEYACQICNASFKSNSALQAHMNANLHRNKVTKVYECPYCRKPFVRNINLKGHIRAVHRDIARVEEMEDPRLPHDDSLVSRPSNIDFNINSNANRKRQLPAILGARSVPMEMLPGNSSQPQQVSLVTADGHTIEILHGVDPNAVTVPMTLVPSSEAEAMSNVASSIAASLGLEQGVHGTEFVTGVTSDGSQAIYVMDTSQPAVEVDMSAMGLTAEGTVIYDADDPHSQQQFIVQDIHGNQFRKVTGIDEHGKPVIFFQLTEEHEQVPMAPTILEQDIQLSTDASNGQQTQVILTTAEGHEDTVYDLVPEDQDSSDTQVHIMTPISESSSSAHIYKESNHQGTNVQQLHIVLDQNESNNEDGGGNVNGPETFDQVEHEQEIIEDEGDTVMVIQEVPEGEEEHPAPENIDHDANTQLVEETGNEEQDARENQAEEQNDDDMDLIEAEVMQ